MILQVRDNTISCVSGGSGFDSGHLAAQVCVQVEEDISVPLVSLTEHVLIRDTGNAAVVIMEPPPPAQTVHVGHVVAGLGAAAVLAHQAHQVGSCGRRPGPLSYTQALSGRLPRRAGTAASARQRCRPARPPLASVGWPPAAGSPCLQRRARAAPRLRPDPPVLQNRRQPPPVAPAQPSPSTLNWKCINCSRSLVHILLSKKGSHLRYPQISGVNVIRYTFSEPCL